MRVQLNTHNSVKLMAEQNLQNVQQGYKKDLTVLQEQLDEANKTIQQLRLS